MVKLLRLTLVVLITVSAYAGDTREEHITRLKKAAIVVDELLWAPDAGVPVEVLEGAHCVAVVPSMFRAGFIFGGRHGEGVATCRTEDGWSAPAFFTVTGGSWGLQIGAQSVDLVMMVMNEEGMNGLLSGNFELGGNISVAAGPWGRDASGKLGWDAAVLTYSRAKGVYAGLSLEGAKISKDKDATEDVYGDEDLSHQLILKGRVEPPPEAKSFLQAVAHAKIVADRAE